VLDLSSQETQNDDLLIHLFPSIPLAPFSFPEHFPHHSPMSQYAHAAYYPGSMTKLAMIKITAHYDVLFAKVMLGG
jgi:hypothetical protein